MSFTRVVNVHRTSCDEAITRPSVFGNPFVLGKDGDRLQVLEKFSIYFFSRLRTDPKFRASVEQLRGKTLGCVCKPQQCHGDVIAAFLNGDLTLDTVSI